MVSVQEDFFRSHIGLTHAEPKLHEADPLVAAMGIGSVADLDPSVASGPQAIGSPVDKIHALESKGQDEPGCLRLL